MQNSVKVFKTTGFAIGGDIPKDTLLYTGIDANDNRKRLMVSSRRYYPNVSENTIVEISCSIIYGDMLLDAFTTEKRIGDIPRWIKTTLVNDVLETMEI